MSVAFALPTHRHKSQTHLMLLDKDDHLDEQKGIRAWIMYPPNMLWGLPLPETSSLLLKIGHPKKKVIWSNPQLSGVNSLLVSGRVCIVFFSFPKTQMRKAWEPEHVFQFSWVYPVTPPPRKLACLLKRNHFERNSQQSPPGWLQYILNGESHTNVYLPLLLGGGHPMCKTTTLCEPNRHPKKLVTSKHQRCMVNDRDIRN